MGQQVMEMAQAAGARCCWCGQDGRHLWAGDAAEKHLEEASKWTRPAGRPDNAGMYPDAFSGLSANAVGKANIMVDMVTVMISEITEYSAEHIAAARP